MVLDPDVAGALPQDDGLTLLVYFGHKDRLTEWKRDLAGSLARAFEKLPEGPPVDAAERVSPVLGRLEAPNLRRSAARPGLALVGDAALASDPTAGVGCSWAFQSAEWLVDDTAAALLGEEQLERALRRYRRRHRSQLIGHHRLICLDSRAGSPSPIERLFFSAAPRDAAVARHLHDFASRKIRPREFLAPSAIARAMRARVALAAPPAAAPPDVVTKSRTIEPEATALQRPSCSS